MESSRSVLGMRVTWTCAACRRIAVTHGISYVGSARIEAPPGWRIAGQTSLCADHAIELNDEAAAREQS